LKLILINQSSIRSRSVSLGIIESLLAAVILKESSDNVRAKDERDGGGGVGNPRPQPTNPRRKTTTRK
jgi:hypothetical protein